MAKTRRRLLKQFAILTAPAKIAFIPEIRDLHSQSDCLRNQQRM
jgi:hypothetical protein